MDVVALISIVALFALSIAYVNGCTRLKGIRP